ncbi:MAG: hypothetical protein IKW74_04080, partial [Thermoguttaceae bacterium]|nr:hypothetical protein [Thermoguttaceae bacterium]
NVIAQVNALLERQYGNNQNIMIKMDPQIGKILVHATRRNQRVVQQFLAGLNIYPSSGDDQVMDPRIELGIVRPATGMPSGNNYQGNNYQNGRNTADISIFVPVNRSLADIESLLTRLFENRLEKFSNNTGVDVPYTERQKVVYRFTRRKTPYDQRTRFCDLEIDPLNNRISISGDQALCYQMNQLLTTMDQQPSKKGNVRRFISIRNSDSQVIKDVIEQEHQVPQSIYWNQNNNGRVPWQVIFWNKNRKPADLFPVSELEVAIQRINQNPAGLARIENQEERLAASEQTGNSNRVSHVSYTGEDVHQDTAVHSADYQEEVVDDSRHGSHIRQIAYQDDLGAGLNPVGHPALEPNVNPGAVPEMNPNVPGGVPGMNPGVGPGNPFRNGVGVVQDYIPQVLTDLDVVIVDAPESEFERIKKMIEQIEELAKLAEPKTEIYFLKNINCVMLNGLLDELYTQMFMTKQGRVMLYPMQTPNALFLAGWGDAFDSMKNLIDFFDQPLETNGSMLQVIHLKYISASETAEQLMTFFPTVQPYTGGFSPKIRVYADVRSNSLIVHAAANDLKQIQDLLVKLDVNKAETKLMTRIFPLKYSLAEDIRTTIMNAILPAREGTLETTAAKYPILEILSVDETGRKLIESGIMMDVDISADVYHQQLIVNAPEDCMPFMEELIRLLDVAPKRAQIRFFQVKNGDATQIVETLRSLLATDDNPTSMPTIPQAEGEEAFVPVRFALDSRTNVIIAAAGPKDLAVIDALILALDVKDTQERKEKVVQLRNVQALRIAQAIDDYLAQKQEMEIASGALSEYQLVESQVIVIPESITNSIIVSAAPEYLDQIVEMINSFDKEPPQVMIQVLIAEVTLSNQEEFGIETGFQNSTSFDRSLITTTSSGSTGDPGFDMLNGSGPGQNMNAVNNVKDIAGQVLNDFGMGADSDLSFGGFIVSASSRSIQLTLRALRQKNRLQVLSRPQITAMDNQQAFILVGQRVPRIKGTTMTNYGTQTDTQDTPVGLILLVTPRVSADGQVIMEIGAEKSSLGSDSDAVPIYASGNTVIKSPSIDTIQAMTAISAHDGETVMLGGLLTSSKEKISSGVPYLSDIPLLGWFFRYDQEVETRKELLIVMTPRILNKQEDFEEVKRVEAAKMSWVLDDAMALHGNMGLFDPMSGNGMSTKRTRSLVNDLVHMDHMDELETKPGYSPSRDYKDKTDREYELDHDAMNKNIGLPDKEENFIKQPERSNRPVSESREQDTSDKRQKLFLTTEPVDEGGGQWQNGNTPQQNDFRLNDDFRLNNDNQSNLLQQSR